MLGSRGSRQPVTSADDKYVFTAYHFLRKWQRYDRMGGDPDRVEMLRREGLLLENMGLYYAFETFFSPQEDKTRTMLEAYILARLSDEEIASRLDGPKGHSRWYERLFFNVRDRIDRYRYIMDIVLPQVNNQGVENYDLGNVTKWFAYWGGADIADMVYDGYDKHIRKPGPEQNRMQFFFEHFATQCVTRAAAGVNSVAMGQWSFKDFSEYSFRVQELVQKKSADEGGLRTPLESIAEVMMQAIPWSVGSSRRKQLESSPLKDYSGHSAELRADEIMSIAAGDAPFDPEYIRNQKLPPPRDVDADDEKTEQGS